MWGRIAVKINILNVQLHTAVDAKADTSDIYIHSNTKDQVFSRVAGA